MIAVAAFYRFTRFADADALRPPIRDLCARLGVRGSLLVAPEGLNGTLAGAPDAIAEVMAHLRRLPGCADLTWKESTASEMPFGRLKVRLKREIVTMGCPEADPARTVGHYVPPSDWNALISQPEVAVIDTRNAYEVRIGSFAGAIDPGLDSFGQFPGWWAQAGLADRPVAMFCTGGIRCEKATALARLHGACEVYHLEGGILRYLEEIPAERSLWHGECFVFDQRVAVGHGLVEGQHALCHACRRPVSPADRHSPDYEAGVSCPACIGERPAHRRDRFRERERQVRLAAQRGRAHLGPEAVREV